MVVYSLSCVMKDLDHQPEIWEGFLTLLILQTSTLWNLKPLEEPVFKP